MTPTENPSAQDVPAPAGPAVDAAADSLPSAVVGIGASAGGLEPACELFRDLPSDTGMTFVFVSHLDPAHKSALADILGKVAGIPVREVQDGDLIRPNHAYVIPPNQDMELSNERLQLTPRTVAREPHMPIG